MQSNHLHHKGVVWIPIEIFGFYLLVQIIVHQCDEYYGKILMRGNKMTNIYLDDI